jgi:hypothetical protein
MRATIPMVVVEARVRVTGFRSALGAHQRKVDIRRDQGEGLISSSYTRGLGTRVKGETSRVREMCAARLKNGCVCTFCVYICQRHGRCIQGCHECRDIGNSKARVAYFECLAFLYGLPYLHDSHPSSSHTKKTPKTLRAIAIGHHNDKRDSSVARYNAVAFARNSKPYQSYHAAIGDVPLARIRSLSTLVCAEVKSNDVRRPNRKAKPMRAMIPSPPMKLRTPIAMLGMIRVMHVASHYASKGARYRVRFLML